MELTEHQRSSSFCLHSQFNNVSRIARLPREAGGAPNLVELMARLDKALTAGSVGGVPAYGRAGWGLNDP